MSFEPERRVDREITEQEVQQFYNKVAELAKFIRSVLHWEFPRLEELDPTIPMLSTSSKFLLELLKARASKEHHQFALMEELIGIFSDIAEAVEQKNGSVLKDAMMEIDDFFYRNGGYPKTDRKEISDEKK